MNYKLTLVYNGSNYHGWAIQPNYKTIQGVLSEILKRLFDLSNFQLYASGRTDKGVHALEQVINLKHKNLNLQADDLMHAINSQLDYDIRIINCEQVCDDFHARFWCKHKTYCYVINTNPTYDVFKHNLIYQYNKPVDLNKLNEIKKLFIGEHNFLSFSTSEYDVKDCVRNVNALEILSQNDLVIIKIDATGFLRSMVRMIVGCLLAYNENLITIDDINDCLINPLKGKVKFKAPACGLYLYKVFY